MPTQLKPKVICKNLEDIIKESMFSTKRNSFQDSGKKQASQRVLKSQPRQRRSNERCNTSINSVNRLTQSGNKLNASLSKHSLESKQKINFLEASKKSLNVSYSKPSESKRNKNGMIANSAVQFYQSSNKKTRKQTQSFGSIPSVHTKSLYFNQIDAIFTQLEDFLRQAREKFCLQVDFLNEENTSNILANELGQLSTLFRQQLSRLLQKSVNHQTELQVLKPKNKSSSIQSKQKQQSRQNSATKSSKQPVYSQAELIKIEEFMQRQNTINSTINSQPHQDQYIPTQTDAQILSMLVYKNKLNNTKRKIQNTYNHGQQLLGPWVKSGRSSKDGQGEYSFRRGNCKENSKQKDRDVSLFNNFNAESSMKKKKNQHFPTQKSCSKQNRQKSIYEIVLEQNRRSKGSWVK